MQDPWELSSGQGRTRSEGRSLTDISALPSQSEIALTGPVDHSVSISEVRRVCKQGVVNQRRGIREVGDLQSVYYAVLVDGNWSTNAPKTSGRLATPSVGQTHVARTVSCRDLAAQMRCRRVAFLERDGMKTELAIPVCNQPLQEKSRFGRS